MNWKELFTAKGAIEKALGAIEKLVPDLAKKNELKFEVYKIMASSEVAKYVRALIALLFFVVWLFFPEKLEGRQVFVEYIMYAILGYYFLIDRSLNHVKRKK